MKPALRICAIIALLFTAFSAQEALAGKTVKIKLTGTAYENILMTVGNSGRTEVISDLPYILEVPKDEMPVRLKFQSDNYIYYNIDVPKKPVDDTGHVYIVKINEMATSLNNNKTASNNNVTAAATPSEVKGIDTTHGVNAAPVTGAKNEKTFALIITNEDYDMAANVDNALNDGLAIKEYCIKTLGIPGANIRYTHNATYGKMRKAISDIADITKLYDGDVNLLFYYAGHGIPDNKTKDAFLMPVDADGTDTSLCLSLNSLYDSFNSMNLNRCVVFLDACFSGSQRDGEMIVAARGVKLKPKEAEPKGKTIVFSATSGDEAAYSHKEEQHGLFTYFLLKKLQETKGNVKLGDLAEYLIDNVGKQSRIINNNKQTPTVSVPAAIGDSWKTINLRK